MNSVPAIEMRDVDFSYEGDPFHLSIPVLCIQPGERVACIGPSGCGKTTLLHLAAGILRPESGTITCGGFDVTAAGENALRAWRIQTVGLVFQEFELLEYLDAMDNILLPSYLNHALARDETTRFRAKELARAARLEDALGRRPAHLSQGERQRVALCRALVTNPDILLCDEPTGNLDPATAGRAMDLLMDQASRGGQALLVVTHDHGLLDRFDRTFDMDAMQPGGAE